MLDSTRLRGGRSHHYVLITIRRGRLFGLAHLRCHGLGRSELGFGACVTFRCLVRVELCGGGCGLAEEHAVIDLQAL